MGRMQRLLEDLDATVGRDPHNRVDRIRERLVEEAALEAAEAALEAEAAETGGKKKNGKPKPAGE